MVRLIALIISISLQFIAAFIALRLMKLTKYRLSWILLSSAFMFMAVRRVIILIQYYNPEYSYTITVMSDWMGVLISFLIITGVILIRELFYSLKRAEKERIRAEKRVLTAIINTEEKEKKRFAKDLHDGLGPLLSTVKMSVSALLQTNQNNTSLEIIKNADLAIDEAIVSIKEISNNLSPHILANFGLASAINTFVNKLQYAKTININFKTNMHNERFNHDTEVILYRVVCELINNTIKHAAAKNIDINLTRHDKIVAMEYMDDGKGFDSSQVGQWKNKGMGFSNIATRIKSINGTFIMESQPQKGINAIIKVNV